VSTSLGSTEKPKKQLGGQQDANRGVPRKTNPRRGGVGTGKKNRGQMPLRPHESTVKNRNGKKIKPERQRSDKTERAQHTRARRFKKNNERLGGIFRGSASRSGSAGLLGSSRRAGPPLAPGR